MNYKATIADIARELNTKPTTVSRNRVASSPRSGKTHFIGVIIPNAEIDFFGTNAHGIGRMTNLNDYMEPVPVNRDSSMRKKSLV